MDGPLNAEILKKEGPFDPWTSCADKTQSESWLGARTLTNNGSSDVRISGASFIESDNVEILEQVLVPGESPPGRTFITSVPMHPNDYDPPLQWSHRIVAQGASISPGDTYELLLRVRTVKSGKGSATGVRTAYQYANKQYVYEDSNRVVLLGLATPKCPEEQSEDGI